MGWIEQLVNQAWKSPRNTNGWRGQQRPHSFCILSVILGLSPSSFFLFISPCLLIRHRSFYVIMNRVSCHFRPGLSSLIYCTDSFNVRPIHSFILVQKNRPHKAFVYGMLFDSYLVIYHKGWKKSMKVIQPQRTVPLTSLSVQEKRETGSTTRGRV